MHRTAKRSSPQDSPQDSPQALQRTKRRASKRHRRASRVITFEALELRRVLAADWRNPVDSLDVDTDGFVVPIDALKIINDLNSTGARELPEQHDGTSPYFDVDGDRFVAPVDVLAIINHLNSGLNVSGKRVLTERGLLTTESDVTITLGQENLPQIYRVQIDSSVDSTDTQPIVEDVLAVYLVDPVEQDRTLVDRGQPGSTLFTLAGRKFEVASGVAAWDGSVLELDLTGVQSRGTALLRFQLIGADSDSGTRFTISPLTNRIQDERIERLAFPDQRSVVPGGLSVDLATLTTPTGVSATVENIKFNSITRRYTADMRLRNDGTPLGRDVVAIFPGLVNVAMMNASGVTSQFDPYVNFRNAIPSGGLDRGMTSEAVEITLFSPSLAPFSLRPTFRAGANHPPALDALGPLTVMPGSSLTVALHGTDQDGDALTYSLTADRSLPAGKLAADGKLTIRPKPNQVGSYTLDVVVSDGVLETHRAVALNVVADPDTTTRVSGVVQQVNGQPLAGVPIEIGGVQGLTGANGSFTLNLGAGPIVTDTIKIRGDLVTGGLTFPYIAEKLPLLLEHDVYAQVNNVITRPIYLPALDVANSKQINPAVDTTVTTAAIPGASVFVAAGTLMNQQGTPFTGRLSITEVPITLTPAALPNGLHPDLVVTIQPGDMVFARPAPISLPNRAGYPAGTVMDLWSINPVTGTFEVVGMGKVRDDGTMVDTISGGVRNSSWHDFAAVNLEPKDTEDERNEDPGCDECGAERPLTSSVELHSGAVIETHTLTTYQSLGAERGLTLTYDSLRADPRPIVHVGLDATKDVPANCVQNGAPCLVAGRPIPEPDDKSLLVASLSLTLGDFEYQAPGYSGGIAGLAPGQNFWTYQSTTHVDAVLQADLRNQPSGIFAYNMNAGFMRGDQNGFTGSLSATPGELISVNSIASPFGAGWSIAGWQSIAEQADGRVLLIDGDGSELKFTPGALPGTYQSPTGDFSTLEKVAGVFRRTLVDKTVYQFNAANQLATITDRHGNVTTFQYTSGRLTAVVDPVGLSTAFTYTGARVTQITDPAGRVTLLAYDSAGNLLSVTDPDGARRTWTYDGDRHMISETDQLGRREETLYGFHGRAIGGVTKDGSRIQVDALQTQGLLPISKTSDPLRPGSTVTITGNSANYAEQGAAVSQTPLDSKGQSQTDRDRYGLLGTVGRDANNLPTFELDGRGHATLYQYDSLGNMVSRRDELSGGGEVIGSISPEGEIDRYTFAGHAGQMLYIDGPSGSFNVGLRITDTNGAFIYSIDRYFGGNFNVLPVAMLPNDGQYSLTVEYQYNALDPNVPPPKTGGYNFRLIDLADVTPLSLDRPLAGSLSATQLYRFSGAAGQKLHLVDRAAANLALQLITPSGLAVPNTYPAVYETEFVLPESGEYSLALRRFSPSGEVSRYDYLVTLTDPIALTRSGLNVEYSGVIGTPSDTYRFTALGGDRLQLNWTGAGYHAIAWYDDTTGNLLYDGQPGALSLPITESGRYRLRVFRTYPGYVGETDEFSFQLTNLADAPLVSIGDTLSGTFDPVSSSITYRFQGQANQVIDMFSAQTLIMPTLTFGTRVIAGGPNIVRLPKTGIYTLVLQTYNAQTPTVDYSFKLADVSNIQQIARDQPIDDTVVAGQRRYYKIHLDEGSEIYFDDRDSDPAVLISSTRIDGNGSFFALYGYPLAQNEQRIQYIHAGDYIVALDAPSASGAHDYHFTIRSRQESTLSTTIGQLVTTTLTEPLETRTVTFQGVAGQRLYYDVVGDNRYPYLNYHLYGPTLDVSPLAFVDFSSDAESLIVLPETGEYRFEVSKNEPGVRSATFRFIDVDAAPPLASGQQINDSLDPGTSVDAYRFTATRGQELRLDRQTTDALFQTLVFTPDGERLYFSDFPVDLPAAQSGDYAIVLRNNSTTNAAPINYGLLVEDRSRPSNPPTVFDQTYTGVGIGSEIEAGRFDANAGDTFFFDPLAGNGSLYVYDSQGALVRPNNQFSTAGFTSDQFVVLPRTDHYTMKVDSTGDFRFRWRDVRSAVEIQTGMNYDGQVGTTAAALFRFTAAAGHKYFLDRTGGVAASEATYSFVSPNLQPFYNFGQFIEPSVTPYAGEYYLAITRSYSAGTYSFQLRDWDDATPVSEGVLYEGVSQPAAQAIRLAYEASAGQKIRIDGVAGYWLIVDPTYDYVGSMGESGVYTFERSGRYLFIRDDDIGQFSPQYSFTLSTLTEPVTPIEPGYIGVNGLSMTYDSTFHQLTSIVDELGRTTTIARDPVTGDATSQLQIVGAVGGGDDLLTVTTYLPSGLVDTITDPQGRITDYDYDSRGRAIAITRAKGTALEAIVRYEYDAAGNRSAEIDELGRRTEFQYDGRNRLTRVTGPDPDGVGPLTSPVTNYAYDLAGNRTSTTDPTGRATQISYDTLNRPATTTDAAGGVTRYSYDLLGYIAKVVDPSGAVTRYSHDERGRMTKMIDAGAGVTSYEYDLSDNLTSITDPLGNVTRFEYDARNRLTKTTDPLGAVTSMLYDSVDRLVGRTDRLGRSTIFSYDDLDHVVRETWRNADGTIANTIDYTYDRVGNLLSMQDQAGTIQYTWDTLTRRTSEVETLPGGIISRFDYGYDLAGNRTTRSETVLGSTGPTTQYQYDALDRVARILQFGAGVSNKRVDLAYDAAGRSTSVSRFSDLDGLTRVLTGAFTYDSAGRTSGVTYRNAANALLESFAYQYDAVSRISRFADVDGATDYVYNSVGELSSANHVDATNPDETYQYDKVGNRTSSQRHGAGYVTGDGNATTADANRLSSDGVYRYTYDAEGNLATRTKIADGQTREFKYDHRNRLVEVTDRVSATGAATKRVRFQYDALDRRVSTEVDSTPADGHAGPTTYFVYAGGELVTEMLDTDGGDGPAAVQVTRRNLYGPAVDQVLAQDDGAGQTRWYLADHVGTIRDVVDGQGQVADHLKYDSFGNVIAQSNSANSPRFQFTGREYDDATGLLYFRARYYDPSTGRFLQEDPLGHDAGDANLYRYVGNNPVSYNDPDGREPTAATGQPQTKKLAPGPQMVKDAKDWAAKQVNAVRTFGRAVYQVGYDVVHWKDRMDKAANSTAEQQIDQVQQAKKETIKAGKVCAIGAKKTMTVGNPGGKVASMVAFVTGKIKGKLQGKNGSQGQPSSGDGAKSH